MHDHQHVNMSPKVILASITLGLFFGYLDNSFTNHLSRIIIELVTNLLKFAAIPTLMSSIIVACLTNRNESRFANVLKATIKYTLFTTIIAAFTALIVYLAFNPAGSAMQLNSEAPQKTSNISNYVSSFVPSNLLKDFADSNVIALVFGSIFIGLASRCLNEKEANSVHNLFSVILKIFTTIAVKIINVIPYILFAFIVVIFSDLGNSTFNLALGKYLIVIVLANLIQALITLPLILWFNGISAIKILKVVYPSLLTAFFSKSSSANMPITMSYTKKLGVKHETLNFTIPICTTINMNACAAFIFSTVFFVAEMSGMEFQTMDYILFVFLATLGAIGNAGVPMGCFFMATTFLVGMNVPTYLMGVILPFYLVLDMVETAINVWSDIVVTNLVSKDLS